MTVDASCAGKACDGLLAERGAKTDSDSEWCEVLFAQHIPKGAYIDVDEVKVIKYKDRCVTAPADCTLCTSGMHFRDIGGKQQVHSENNVDLSCVASILSTYSAASVNSVM